MPRLIALVLTLTALASGTAIGGCSTSDGVDVAEAAGDASVSQAPTEAQPGRADSTETPQSACAKSCPGCCHTDGTCVKLAATSVAFCGAKGVACAECKGDNLACVGGAFCGCESNAQCGPGLVCDLKTKKCKTPCTAAGACATGCCTTSGFCEPGTAGEACGTSGTCVDCSNRADGSGCVAGKCGCNTAADCPKWQACDPTTNKCSAYCSPSSLCNGGCCSAVTGACEEGYKADRCGKSGMCKDCNAPSASGPVCLFDGQCGCAYSQNCPAGQACKDGKCGTSCSTSVPCNGGCCSASSNGTCRAGGADVACGSNGYACEDCGDSANGNQCITSPTKRSCGCNVNGDCPAGRQCKSGQCK